MCKHSVSYLKTAIRCGTALLAIFTRSPALPVVLLASLEWLPAVSARSLTEWNTQLQMVSEVYKKQPYIQIPAAWIDSTLRNEVLEDIRKGIGPAWEAQTIALKGPWLQGDWIYQLKCHPAANIKIFKKGSEDTEFAILLLYPQSYRDLIEDPLSENPPPVKYMGSARRLAFFYYPHDKIYEEVHNKIVAQLKLTVEED